MSAMTKNLVLVLSTMDFSASAVEAQPPPRTAPAAAELVAAAPSATASTNLSGPRIQFATRLYDFGRAAADIPVKYTYFFTNGGNQVLRIENVRTSCGCTTVGKWSEQVEPGETGSIPVQLSSSKLIGPVSRTIRVTCNDRSTPSVLLEIKGTIWKPVEVKPLFAVLKVAADSQRGSAVVHIINNMEEPLAVYAPETDNRAFAAELKTNQPGKEFSLVIRTVPPLSPGPVQGKFTVKTSSTNAPVLTVTSFATVPAIIAVTPSHLLLPPAPLADLMLRSVMIKNNTTNDIKLSDAAINAKDVGVDLLELQPGRSFRARLTFPQGFEIPHGRQVEFTFKSSHPLCPLVKVPVTQAAHPATPPAPPPAAAPPPLQSRGQ